MFLVTVSCVANERRNVFIVLKMAPGGNGFQRLYNDDIWRGTLHFPFFGWIFFTASACAFELRSEQPKLNLGFPKYVES